MSSETSWVSTTRKCPAVSSVATPQVPVPQRYRVTLHTCTDLPITTKICQRPHICHDSRMLHPSHTTWFDDVGVLHNRHLRRCRRATGDPLPTSVTTMELAHDPQTQKLEALMPDGSTSASALTSGIFQLPRDATDQVYVDIVCAM